MWKQSIKYAWQHFPLKLLMLKALRRTIRLPERIYRHLHFDGIYDVRVEPGAEFRIRSFGYWIENDLFWAGYAGNYERVSLALWRELCRESHTILDVGANTGVYSLAAAALNPEARIIAFEPVPYVREKLLENIALNGFRVAVEGAAVSDHDGVATLYDTYNLHTYTASLSYEMLGNVYTRSYDVPTVSLDSYCATHGIERVDLVKIDVERHESAVIRGLRRTLAQSKPTVLVEILDREVGATVAEQLSGAGYHAFEIREEGAEDGIFPAESLGRADRNYLLCRPDVARRLQLPEARLIL